MSPELRAERDRLPEHEALRGDPAASGRPPDVFLLASACSMHPEKQPVPGDHVKGRLADMEPFGLDDSAVERGLSDYSQEVVINVAPVEVAICIGQGLRAVLVSQGD